MTNSTIFHGGNIVTMREPGEVVSAFLVAEGRFIAVGDLESLQAQAPQAELVDLKGKTVLPGLIDAHSHLEMMAYSWELMEDCRSSNVSSIEEIVEVLSRKAATVDPGTWIMGHGEHFQWSKLEEQRYPDRHDLDRVSLEHPIFYRSSYHLNVFNSKGLEVLGVTRDTPDAPGGRIERDEQGEPTGRTYDMFAALNGPQASLEEMVAGLAKVQNRYLELGVTAIGEIPLHSMGLDGMLEFAKRGEMDLRATLYPTSPNAIDISTVENGALQAKFEGVDPSRVRLGGAKLFLDGGLTSSAAALHAEYPKIPGYRGEMTYDHEELKSRIRLVDATGGQVAVHAIGDRALDQVLDVLSELKAEGALLGSRHRIEHAGNIWITPERLQRIQDLGVVAVPQPAFILTTALGYREDLGDMVGDLMPFRTLKDAGVALAGNSDAIGITADQHNPFYAIQAAVTRTTLDGKPVDPHQSITVYEAIEMYTRDASFAIGREEEIGQIASGMFADFVVLDRDILSIPSEQIHTVTAAETWVGGERKYVRA